MDGAQRPRREELSMNVRTFMTPNPRTIGRNEKLSVAEEMMQHGRFRRLPVVDDRGALVGIITDGDLRERHAELSTMTVAAAMTEKPFTVDPDAAIDTAASMMLEHKIDSIPVVDTEHKLIGIVTETDLLRGFLRLLRDLRSGA
jgi:CBS domain-containing protein